MQVEIEPGKTLAIQLLAEGKMNDRAEREVFFDLNGQMRSIYVQDKKASKVSGLNGSKMAERMRGIAGDKNSTEGPAWSERIDWIAHAWTDSRNQGQGRR